MDYNIPYSDTTVGLSGYTGLNLQEINLWTRRPAERSIVAPKGYYKAGFTRLINGNLLASPCYQDDTHNKIPMAIFRSKDSGASWHKVDTRGDELLGKEPALQALKSGRILLITSHPHGFRIARSDDDGVTWQTTALGKTTETIDYSHQEFAMMRNVIEDKDGSLSLFMTSGRGYDGAADRSKGWIYSSGDDGATWERKREIAVWDNPEPMFDEGQIVRLPGGKMLGIGRVSGNVFPDGRKPPYGPPAPPGDHSGNRMILAESNDDGLTWGEPRAFLDYSEVHAHIIVLDDGRLLCSYLSYHLPFGIYGVMSTDEGKTWDTDHPIQLAIGKDYNTGWPTSIQLPDRSIVTLYATTPYPLKDPKIWASVTECVRWRLP